MAKAICDVLGLSNNRDAVSSLDGDEKGGVGITDAIGRVQQTTIISESGLYALIMRSRKPEAKAFRKWVMSEVLLAIRKTVSYSVTDPIESLNATRILVAMKRKGTRIMATPAKFPTRRKGIGVARGTNGPLIGIGHRKCRRFYLVLLTTRGVNTRASDPNDITHAMTSVSLAALKVSFRLPSRDRTRRWSGLQTRSAA